MRRKLPPLNAILAFEAAARHSNFTRAAQELSVAQPAVTRHVARLEDWIGSQLFRRNGSVVQLTREGTVLSELATTLLDRLELGIRDATRVGKDELVVGASFGIAHLWLMPKISALRMASEATVNFMTADDYRAFDDPSVDFSIRFGRGSFGVNCADLLFREHCQIIVAPKFLDQHPEFDPDAPLATLDPRLIFDHGDPRDVGWVTWSVWCELTGQSLPDRGQISKIGSYPTMLDLVSAGEGIGIGTMGLEDDLVASGAIVRVGTPITRNGFGYYLVYRKELLDKPSFARLRDHLLDQL
ncbi:LysR family transcriptional regulator [Planktomarina temperata]|nr:LysR family transcriptional regulator [bacterium]MDB9698383.1 LysR family transcriptional regulator [Planktomarina temperata]